jgi:hypothetical protein
MPRTPPSAIPQADPVGDQPLLIDDAFRLLIAENWRMIAHVPEGFLWVRRRDENNFHEKPVEFVLNSATLADVLRLPTWGEFRQGASIPATGQTNG